MFCIVSNASMEFTALKWVGFFVDTTKGGDYIVVSVVIFLF